MKYHTLSTSSLAAEGKSTLTIYADPHFAHDKMVAESEVTSIRSELEIVQRALKLQTRRCRQLVSEYTRKLQEKDIQMQSEKRLRDNQLSKVLRALLLFEARLKQEQTYISHQLNEKDYIIKTQNNDIRKLLSNQYCKNCNQLYSASSNLESLESGSDYMVSGFQDYQSSNFESLDSSCDLYTTPSENDFKLSKSQGETVTSEEENSKVDYNFKNQYTKKCQVNENNRNLKKRHRGHKKSIGTYFEVLKLRSDCNDSESSNDERNSIETQDDSKKSESDITPENLNEKIKTVTGNIENLFGKRSNSRNDGSSDVSEEIYTTSSLSDFDNTVVGVDEDKLNEINAKTHVKSPNKTTQDTKKGEDLLNSFNVTKITETIAVFDSPQEGDDNWYASASDQEDDNSRDIYRNNPVLECMNQILLQNVNDAMNSPPKSPAIDRKIKHNKRVKFCDENNSAIPSAEDAAPAVENKEKKELKGKDDYYETPIQQMANFYEVPQSIYSNDYEQILSSCNGSVIMSPRKMSPTLRKENLQEKQVNRIASQKLSVSSSIEFDNLDCKSNHYYVEMESNNGSEEKENKYNQKSKYARSPPALPPKPANLVSKYKIQQTLRKNNVDKLTRDLNCESEPDYCSISELNLPTTENNKIVTPKKILVAKQQSPTSPSEKRPPYDPISLEDSLPNLVAKSIEKNNIQVAKQTLIKHEKPIPNNVPIKAAVLQSNDDVEIPKLPQVSEIIIPKEAPPTQKEERITQDNYIKNNSQLLKQSPNRVSVSKDIRRPIVIGKSVSSLITGFNNQQLRSELQSNRKSGKEVPKLNERMFSSFECLQNFEKQEKSPTTPNFEKFDLSQNFEEFKLDDCEIGEEYNLDSLNTDSENGGRDSRTEMNECVSPVEMRNSLPSNPMEILKTPPLQTNNNASPQKVLQNGDEPNNKIAAPIVNTNGTSEPTYEHFLECTGLSSKSILTPSRLLSNHKSMLKPKDVKLRSKVKSNSVFERHGSTIKYWSEPYL